MQAFSKKDECKKPTKAMASTAWWIAGILGFGLLMAPSKKESSSMNGVPPKKSAPKKLRTVRL
jgi:hypothetical protein